MAEIINLGSVGFNPTGPYDATRTYQKLDVVYYQGSSYVAISDSLSQLPTNADYWLCIAAGSLKQFIYDSVASMKADNTLAEGMAVQTLGYYEANDGGGAEYIIKTSSSNYYETLDNILVAELITEHSEYNALQLGFDNTGTNDCSVKLQNLLNKKHRINLYFPRGIYKFDNPITCKNDVCFKGCGKGKLASLTENDTCSILYFNATEENQTLFTQESTSWKMDFEDITLLSTSCDWNDKGLSDEIVPYNQYELLINKNNINAIDYVHGGSHLRDVDIVGFSGYGVKPQQAMQIYNLKAEKCGNCVYITTHDVMLYNCYLTASKNAIYCESGANLMVYDCYMDLLVEHGINCPNGYLNGYITGYIDHTGYSGINAQGLVGVNIDVKTYRTGMYFAGQTLEELKNDTLETEFDNFSKGSGISCSFTENAFIKIDCFKRTVDDAGNSSKYSPACIFYNRYCKGSIVDVYDEKLVFIKDYSANKKITVNSQKGLTQYYSGNIYESIKMTKKTWIPSTEPANEVGELWFCTTNQKLYIAVAINGNTATWKEFTFAS